MMNSEKLHIFVHKKQAVTLCFVSLLFVFTFRKRTSLAILESQTTQIIGKRFHFYLFHNLLFYQPFLPLIFSL